MNSTMFEAAAAAPVRARRPFLLTCSRWIAAALLWSTVVGAVAQPREVLRGELLLRSSTVASTRIDPDTAARHGIEPSPRRAVLNVVLLRGKERKPIEAAVTASYRGRSGRPSTIDMREVRANGRVSYMGTYEFLPRQVLDFTVVAHPLHPPASRPLRLRFRERVWGAGEKAGG